MKRRKFNQVASISIGASISVPLYSISKNIEQNYVRLGGPVFEKYADPNEWIAALKQLKYRAAYCPVEVGADETQIKAFSRFVAKETFIFSDWRRLSSFKYMSSALPVSA